MASAYAWQSEKDLGLRKNLVEEIRRLFLECESPLVSESGFPDFVKRLELLLYTHARSKGEYVDRATLVGRLQIFAKQLRGDMATLGPLRSNSSGFSTQLDYLPPDSGCMASGFPGMRGGEELGGNGFFERGLSRELGSGGAHMQADLSAQLYDDPLCKMEDWDFMPCSPACNSSPACEKSSCMPALDADLLDGSILQDSGFGETWFSFPSEDLLSSEDSVCDFDAFNKIPGFSQATDSSGLQQWNSTSMPMVPNNLFVEEAKSSEFSSFNNSLLTPPYQSMPMQSHLGGNGQCRDFESLPSSGGLSPSIFPAKTTSHSQMKTLGLESMPPAILTPKMITPQPLSRHLGSIPDRLGNKFMGSLWDSLSSDVDPLVHAYTCTRSSCDVMCMQLRKLLDHVKMCEFRKKPAECPSCQWVGLLLSMHAQKCQKKPCPLPCCK